VILRCLGCSVGLVFLWEIGFVVVFAGFRLLILVVDVFGVWVGIIVRVLVFRL